MARTIGRTSPTPIPEVVIMRLPVYMRALSNLLSKGAEVVSSQGLGDHLGVTPAQIRKDFSYFGRFGKQGRGYNVRYLLSELRQILGLQREWHTALIGVGRLGRAIIGYPGFAPEGFKMAVAFDVNPEQVATSIGDIPVLSMAELEPTLVRLNIQIAIVAVPAAEAQAVIGRLVNCNIKAILNYAPVQPQVPPDVHVRNIDPVLALQSMTYYLKQMTNGPSSAAP